MRKCDCGDEGDYETHSSGHTNSGWIVALLPISKADLTKMKTAMLMMVVRAVDVCFDL